MTYHANDDRLQWRDYTNSTWVWDSLAQASELVVSTAQMLQIDRQLKRFKSNSDNSRYSSEVCRNSSMPSRASVGGTSMAGGSRPGSVARLSQSWRPWGNRTSTGTNRASNKQVAPEPESDPNVVSPIKDKELAAKSDVSVVEVAKPPKAVEA